jgi:hypothetical protein
VFNLGIFSDTTIQIKLPPFACQAENEYYLSTFTDILLCGLVGVNREF